MMIMCSYNQLWVNIIISGIGKTKYSFKKYLNKLHVFIHAQQLSCPIVHEHLESVSQALCLSH